MIHDVCDFGHLFYLLTYRLVFHTDLPTCFTYWLIDLFYLLTYRLVFPTDLPTCFFYWLIDLFLWLTDLFLSGDPIEDFCFLRSTTSSCDKGNRDKTWENKKRLINSLIVHCFASHWDHFNHKSMSLFVVKGCKI